MMIFERAIETMTGRMRVLRIEEERCTRNRSRLSGCSKCMDLCPENAITIKNKKIFIGESCIECGICAGVCPTDSIMIQEPRENSLYGYIENRGDKGLESTIVCKENQENSKDAFKIPCLGSLSLEFLIGVDILDLGVNMIFKYEDCMECRASRGIELYLENLEKLRRIKDLLEIEKSSIRNLDQLPKLKKKKEYKDEDIDEERRLFLRSIFKTTKDLPNIAVKQILGDGRKPEESRSIAPNPSFKKYRILSKLSGELRDGGLEDRTMDHYFKPHMEKDCKLCGACSTLCPMGALKLEEEESVKVLYIRNDLCSGCGLCQEVCYHKSIVMNKKSLYDFSEREAVVLYKEEL